MALLFAWPKLRWTPPSRVEPEGGPTLYLLSWSFCVRCRPVIDSHSVRTRVGIGKCFTESAVVASRNNLAEGEATSERSREGSRSSPRRTRCQCLPLLLACNCTCSPEEIQGDGDPRRHKETIGTETSRPRRRGFPRGPRRSVRSRSCPKAKDATLLTGGRASDLREFGPDQQGVDQDLERGNGTHEEV